MLGAIIGDIIGSTRKWHNVKTSNLELIPEGSRFTGVTVMTLAVAEWLMTDSDHLPESLVNVCDDRNENIPMPGTAICSSNG